MNLFLEIITTGITNHQNQSVKNFGERPRLIQLAWLLFDQDKYLIDEKNYTIRPDGYSIPEEVSDYNGINQEVALATGNSLVRILKELNAIAQRIDRVVGFNLKAKGEILHAEFIGAEIEDQIFGKQQVDLMEETINFCAIMGEDGFKKPKFTELHSKLFGEPHVEKFLANENVKAIAKSYWELKRRKYFIEPDKVNNSVISNTESTDKERHIPYGQNHNKSSSAVIYINHDYAGFWLRFLAFLIDYVILFLIGSLFLMIINYPMPTDAEPSFFLFGQAFAIINNPFSLIIYWLYFALMENSSQQATIGKMIMGIKVTDFQGKRIGFGKATGRHFGKIISSVILGIGYLMAGFTQKKQALHDQLANCLVLLK